MYTFIVDEHAYRKIWKVVQDSSDEIRYMKGELRQRGANSKLRGVIHAAITYSTLF